MKITFSSPVRHDGKDYNEDDTVDMEDVAAQALIDAGAASLSGKKSAKHTTKSTVKTSEQSSEQGSLDGNAGDDGSDSSANDGAQE